jgi:Domain of unknown function (DUF4328)
VSADTENINNPYAPPTVVDAIAGPPVNGYFRSTKVFAWIAILTIGIATFIECLFEAFGLSSFDPPTLQLLAAIDVICALVGVIIYCVWLFRSAKNAMFFSGRSLSHSAGLAVGYYFIPFFNFVKPILSMSEIYDKTYAIYREKRPVGLLRFWWAAWIGFLILTRIYGGLGAEELGSPPVTAARFFACITVIQVIYILTKRQHQIMSSPELMAKIGRNSFVDTFPSTAGLPMKKAVIPPPRSE